MGNAEEEVPWWAGKLAYWVATVAMLNLPFKLWVDCRTAVVRYSVVKYIG